MTCANCGGQTLDGVKWGDWCNTCGGVVVRPGILIFRHVATVSGPGGVFPIVFDASTMDYAHIGKDEHPPDPKRDAQRDEHGFKPTRLQVVHGSLDYVIASAYHDCISGAPDTKPDTKIELELAPAPWATDAERAIIGTRLVTWNRVE